MAARVGPKTPKSSYKVPGVATRHVSGNSVARVAPLTSISLYSPILTRPVSGDTSGRVRPPLGGFFTFSETLSFCIFFALNCPVLFL
ncbi:unnamed protein product [Vicia faba]|uniref:Uncharacterized protein n=1 Tax=Vicia faba TaxID=3906 RepID=A0AAV1AGX3_VICFA|nr:unnamed protein product [Vicia faba]